LKLFHGIVNSSSLRRDTTEKLAGEKKKFGGLRRNASGEIAASNISILVFVSPRI
jgi:hypothetical protein